MREIRMLRLTWQGMETWLLAVAPSLDPTCEGAVGQPAVLPRLTDTTRFLVRFNTVMPIY